MEGELNRIKLIWEGPFGFWPDGEVPWFNQQTALDRAGVYLWAVRQDDGFLINYVGQSSKIKTRLTAHLKNFLAGQYFIYHPVEFAAGRKCVAYNPKDWKTFILEFPNRAEIVAGHLRLFRLFVASVDSPYDKHLFRQIELKLIETFQLAGNRTKTFLDNERMGTKNFENIELAHDFSKAGNPVFLGLP